MDRKKQIEILFYILLIVALFAPRASDPRDRAPVDELYDALSRVPADLRIPWVLHRVERLSLPETAAACEVSLATVKRRIADAEARIERRLGPGDGTNPSEGGGTP
jgi:RNA polymerase sigma-70 factor (ECF subfamily)